MNPSTRKQTVTIQDVWEARKRIKSIVQPTPLITSPKLSQIQQANVHLKLETLHETGAFKVRGAANKILSLSPEKRKAGVTTFSTGNHGLAVAWIAKQLGMKAVICISNRVPVAKVNAMKQYGAIIERVGDSQDDAEEFCYQLEKEQGLTVIKPFDDQHVIAGQGTIGIEIMEDLPTIDTILIPLSGGGLFSGIALALKSYQPDIRVVGVSMENAAVMAESLVAGQPVVLPEEDTLADSLLGGIGLDNQYTFQMVRDLLDDMIHVSEEEIADGMAFLLEHHQLVAEGAAATGVAAILSGKLQTKGKQIATIITGNNVDMPVIARILQKRFL
ncbi:hydroxyectoine utilization dehydratase EutB [Ornithinibacillus halophilus]|uniref:threonine ammonia-lyase n=1 Tax=Ornithinibacillus halophilus TaxID=930117 RepID=A0A1M5MKL1_9BACI|nr:hydroxyectoine utilization dehydratase EutB [Ornithinibacillus halophilus]SHG77303.1 threonine dehydratase [Ornithinibacillus halophilus]